ALGKLNSIRALKVSAEDQTIVPYRGLIQILYQCFIMHLVAGKLMCEHFLSANTVESFLCLTGSETLVDLIHFVAGCTEMHEVSIRNQEKSQLNLINRATGIQRLRYPTKGRITTPQMKVVTLLQAELNDFVVLEAGLQQESNKALKIFSRCAAGLRNFLWATTSSGSWDAATKTVDNPPPPATMGFACMAHVIELAKVANYRVWADAPLASLRQLPDVGKDYVNQLAGAGVVSLKDIERLGPRTLERILNRKPPFGDRVYESALGVPKYELAAEQVTTAAPECVEFEFTVRLIRSCKFDQVALIVGDDKNRVIFKTVLSTTLIESSGKWSHRIVVHHASEIQLLFTSLISFNFLGIDLNINFPIPWSESCNGCTDQGLTSTLANINQTLPVTVSPYILNSPASVALKKERKQETPKICRSKQAKPSTPSLSTPKGACGSLKQANIFAFFKTTKSHPQQVPEGESANRSTEISPIPKTTKPSSTSALNVSAISAPHTQMPSETPFTGDPLSLLPSPPIQTLSEVEPKKLKRNRDADDCISPETDKMVEEELCSFLASVEATEEERSDFIHYRQLDYTISPIFPVDMDESCDYNTCLKPTKIPESKANNTTSVNFPNKRVENARPKQSPMGFKTPKEMQLLTSLDDVCESTKRVDPPIFRVPTSITPLQPLKKIQSSLLTRIPSSTKLPKKVSFSSLLLPKSECVRCDTGYVSSSQQSTSKKSLNSVNLMDTTSVNEPRKRAEPVFVVQETNEEKRLKEQEMEVLKAEARPSRMLDFQLLRDGWDQLATFIYCYSILEKFDSVDAEFVTISAPRTPPHNTTDFTHLTTDLHTASIDIASKAFAANADSKHECLHPQKLINEIEDQGTDCQHQVEE
ncbi:putative ATP-dependent DNA helicase HFM1, partial [Taenia solium]